MREGRTRVRYDQVRAVDLLVADHLPTCPKCGDICAPEATVCECSQRLVPYSTAPARDPLQESVQAQKETLMHPEDCTCNRCYLDELDNGKAA